MVSVRHVLAVLFGGAILASCAQQEAPLTIEPSYDKVRGAYCEGDLYLDTTRQGRVECRQQCPRGSNAITGARGQRLCVPDNGCPPGTRVAAGTAGQQCVPVNDRGDKPQGQRDPQRPTGG